MDLEHVRRIAQRVAESSGLELVDVEMHGGGKDRMLRIVIDKPAAVAVGVTHEDCVNISREAGTIIDIEEAMSGGPYTLEVSSAGLDRKLQSGADFQRFTGSLLKLMTREPINNNRHFQGRLQSFRDGRLTLDTSPVSKKKQKKMGNPEDAKVEIEFANVERANLVPEI